MFNFMVICQRLVSHGKLWEERIIIVKIISLMKMRIKCPHYVYSLLKLIISLSHNWKGIWRSFHTRFNILRSTITFWMSCWNSLLHKFSGYMSVNIYILPLCVATPYRLMCGYSVSGWYSFFSAYPATTKLHGVLNQTITVWVINPVVTIRTTRCNINPYPTAFPYGNGMVLHFYQQQESSTTKTVHKVINKGLKTYV